MHTKTFQYRLVLKDIHSHIYRNTADRAAGPFNPTLYTQDSPQHGVCVCGGMRVCVCVLMWHMKQNKVHLCKSHKSKDHQEMCSLCDESRSFHFISAEDITVFI